MIKMTEHHNKDNHKEYNNYKYSHNKYNHNKDNHNKYDPNKNSKDNFFFWGGELFHPPSFFCGSVYRS